MDLFDLSATRAEPLFRRCTFPWQVLDLLEAFLLDLGPQLGPEYEQILPGVWVGRGTSIHPLSSLQGPAILGRDCELRLGGLVRSTVLVGDGCVLGHSSEFKNTVLFDGCQVPHLSYVGDSVLGRGVHFGAGAIASNFKAGGGPIGVFWEGQRRATGRNKLGVLAGDGADVGAHAVLNPGTVLGRRVTVYPLVSVRGTVPEATIVKSSDPQTWTLRV